jgi:hypothetical protein
MRRWLMDLKAEWIIGSASFFKLFREIGQFGQQRYSSTFGSFRKLFECFSPTWWDFFGTSTFLIWHTIKKMVCILKP